MDKSFFFLRSIVGAYDENSNYLSGFQWDNFYQWSDCYTHWSLYCYYYYSVVFFLIYFCLLLIWQSVFDKFEKRDVLECYDEMRHHLVFYRAVEDVSPWAPFYKRLLLPLSTIQSLSTNLFLVFICLVWICSNEFFFPEFLMGRDLFWWIQNK